MHAIQPLSPLLQGLLLEQLLRVLLALGAAGAQPERAQVLPRSQRLLLSADLRNTNGI